MYNYMRRCLLNSVKSHNQFFTQMICNKITVYSNTYCTNISWLWNDTTCKRFCSTIIVQNSNAKMVNEEQQKLDEFLSNPDNKKFFQVIELEIDVMRHDAEKVPTSIKPRDWLELLSIQTRTQRKKHLYYLFLNEKSKEKKKAKIEQKKTEWQVKLAKKELEEKEKGEDAEEIKYSLSHNSLFLRIYPQTMNHYYNSKLIWGMMFEPKLVFDCDYEQHMNNYENHNCAKQLTIAFASNRNHDNPMFLYFCNLYKEGSLKRYFQRNMPNLMDKDFPAVVTSQSYLDLFPKDQLVYLTPHCKTNLVEYDPDIVYIIGAMVDKSNPKPLSFAKAKKEGLRMAKLPIEMYLDWGSGSTKNFTINQVLSIMLDLRHTRSWEQALKHVPTRKLKQAREYMLQKKLFNTSQYLERMEKNIDNKKSDEMQASTKPPTARNFTFDAKQKR